MTGGGGGGSETDRAARRVAFESLPVAALLLVGDRIVAANPAYEIFMGVPAIEVEGRTVTDLVGQFVREADVPLVGAAADALRAGTRDEGELWIQVTDASGRIRPIRVDWRPTGNPDESVIYMVGAEREATARASAEGLARAAGELVRCRDERDVLERAADVLYARGLVVTTLLIKDDDPLLEYGPMRSPSRAAGTPSEASRLVRTQRPRKEVLWEHNKDFHQRRAAFFQDVGPLIRDTFPGEAGRQIQSHVRQRRTVQAPLFVNGAPYGALVVTSDGLDPVLTGSLEMFAELVARAIENVRLGHELVQRERLAALGEAAAVMAHEVRNPIAAILNARSLLQKEGVEPSAQAALLSVIGEEALRLDRLVSDLLDLGRPLTPRVKAVDLHELAQQSASVLGARGEAGDVELCVEPGDPVLALIDPELTQLALWNVLRNAVQASPSGTRVTVAAVTRGDRSLLIVDDAGPGFPAERAERILEPFHTTRATGTGIGLAVVRRVVEACQGTIEIGASAGGGGRFLMVFPSPSLPP